MAKRTLFVLFSLFCLVLILVSACSQGATPTPSPNPSLIPTSKPTTSPTANPTTKPASTSVPVSFAGKSVTIIDGTEPGGSTDLTARVYTKYLPQYLPGKPNMIVRNMPGGARTIGTNYGYASKPDGLTLFMASGGDTLNQLVGLKAVRFVLPKASPLITL